ncbi:MAG: hypothetical protein ACKPKO_00445, partial [Candidatus Fonsibacter sp.]
FMCLGKQQSAIALRLTKGKYCEQQLATSHVSMYPDHARLSHELFSTPHASEQTMILGVALVFGPQRRACIVRAIVVPEHLKRSHSRDKRTDSFEWSQQGLCM